MEFTRNSQVELRIPRPVVDQMVWHALEDTGKECCGLLGGRGREVCSIYPLINESPRPEREYRVALGLFRPLQEMRQRGEGLLGIYHSHPTAAAVPSQKDLRQNYYPSAIHFIISLAGPEPDIKGYRLKTDSFEEIRWDVIETQAANPNQ